jgi:hypothetical protein
MSLRENVIVDQTLRLQSTITNFAVPFIFALAIQRTAHSSPSAVEYMRVDHGGAHIFVAEKL